ncbi:MAG: hypothetical protein ACRYG8_03470 [Janthinobacterium lividum]
MREFSAAAFALHLEAVAHRMEHGDQEAMEQAALVVERRAKAIIGHYQDAAAPFAGWAELADATKEDRVRQGFADNDPLERTGGLRDSIEHVAAPKEAVVGSNSEIAEYQELGTGHIPPRSFLGTAAVQTSEQVARILGQGAVTALVGRSVFQGHMEINE